MRRDYETAIKYLGQAVQIDDSNCQYYGNPGEAYRRTGKLDEAFAAFERSTILKPDFLKGHFGLGSGFINVIHSAVDIFVREQAAKRR